MAHRFGSRYQAIEEYLRERIAAAQPGDPLPTDKELCDSFGVSRMTARQAVSRLVEAGLVRREPGKGTFVAHRRLQRDVETLLSFTRQMDRQGRRASSLLLGRAVQPAGPEVAHKLGMQPGDPALHIRRLRLADDVPTAIELVILPEERFGWLAGVNLEHGSLHEALEGRGIIPCMGAGTLTAEAASREDARLLALPPGTPLLVERLTLHDQNGLPIEVGETRYAGPTYALEFQLHRN